MNYYLSLIPLAIMQLYRQSVDAKYVIDTNVLHVMWKNLYKIIEFNDQDPKYTTDSKYAAVSQWAETQEGKAFFTAYKADQLSTNYELLWNFVSTKSQSLIDSKLISKENIDDILRIATTHINPNDVVKVNGITYGEFFEGRSFKINPDVNREANIPILNQIKSELFKAAPGLEIQQPHILPLVEQNEIPEQAKDQSEIKTKLTEFWQRIGDPNYTPATGSYGEMLKKFHNDVTTGDSSLIKNTSEDIIKNIKSYDGLKQQLTFLVKAKTKKFIDEANANLPEKQRAAQATQLSKQVEAELLKKLPISLSIDKEKNPNTILVEAFFKSNEQTDIGDLLHWLDTAHGGDILWTHNSKMISELFEYPVILYALSQIGIKFQLQAGNRLINLDFSSPEKIRDSVFKIFEPAFDAVFEITTDEFKDSYELIKTQKIDSEEVTDKLAEHLGVFDDNDSAKKAIQIF